MTAERAWNIRPIQPFGPLVRYRARKQGKLVVTENQANHLHSRLSDLIRRASQLERRLTSVANNVIGAIPESACEIAGSEDHLSGKIDRLSRALSDIEEVTVRLENGVGVGQSKPSKAVSGY